jgi:hypothetical protein
MRTGLASARMHSRVRMDENFIFIFIIFFRVCVDGTNVHMDALTRPHGHDQRLHGREK